MRIRRLLLSLVFVTAACSRGAIAQQTAMYRGDAAHSGVYAPGADGRYGGLRWRVQTGGPVRSSPAVLGGVVYVGSSDGNVYAIGLADGAVRWRASAGAAVTSSPAVGAGLVVVGTREGRWLALDARTGAVRWRIAGGPDLPMPWGRESGDYWTGSPVIAGAAAYLGGGDGVLRAVTLSSGRVRWQAHTARRMRASPAVANGLVVVGDADGVVYAFDAATGTRRWTHETEGHRLGSDTFGFDRRTIQSSPAIMDGHVFVGARDGWLYALDLASGERLWRYDHQVSWVNTSPAVEPGRVYAGSSDRQFVDAVDAASGQEVWRTRTALTWASPAISGGALYAVDGAAWLTALDKATGAVRWRFRTGGGLFSSPAVAGGLVIFGSDDGGVYAVDAGAAQDVHRAVYWDTAYANANLVPVSAAVRDYFLARDYQRLDRSAFSRFLADRVADRQPSVVVLATDYLPPAVAEPGSDTTLLRRYLETGGKIVSVGTPPLLWPRDSLTGNRDLLHVDRGAAARLLGVTFERGNFDQNGTAVITAPGRALGLEPNWMSSWPADPASVTEVLATDEQGLASAWRKGFGGPAWTGVVQVPAVQRGGQVLNLLSILIAAELRG